MWQLLATLSCLVVLTSAQRRPPFQPLSDELVHYVNKQNTTWKVSCGDRFCARPSPRGSFDAFCLPRVVAAAAAVGWSVPEWG